MGWVPGRVPVDIYATPHSLAISRQHRTCQQRQQHSELAPRHMRPPAATRSRFGSTAAAAAGRPAATALLRALVGPGAARRGGLHAGWLGCAVQAGSGGQRLLLLCAAELRLGRIAAGGNVEQG